MPVPRSGRVGVTWKGMRAYTYMGCARGGLVTVVSGVAGLSAPRPSMAALPRPRLPLCGGAAHVEVRDGKCEVGSFWVQLVRPRPDLQDLCYKARRGVEVGRGSYHARLHVQHVGISHGRCVCLVGVGRRSGTCLTPSSGNFDSFTKPLTLGCLFIESSVAWLRQSCT